MLSNIPIIYSLLAGLIGILFINRLIYLCYTNNRDITYADLSFTVLVSLVWPITVILLIWVAIDENMTGTLMKGKK